jgi:hypothetical protein
MADGRARREPAPHEHSIVAPLQYFGGAPRPEKPTFHAQEHARDNWRPDTRQVTFHDARNWPAQPTFDREGFELLKWPSQIKDFGDLEEVARLYPSEIERLIKKVSGAKEVVAIATGALRRFSKRSPLYKTGQNTQVAHFPHVDWTLNSAPGIGETFFGSFPIKAKPGQRIVGYNIWRVLSEPPQDWPLALCDAQTIAGDDLVAADGVYDFGEQPWQRSEAYMLRHNPAHRWIYFSDMRPEEVLVFRAYDNAPGAHAPVPHVAFEDPTCPGTATGRVSAEARAYAIF